MEDHEWERYKQMRYEAFDIVERASDVHHPEAIFLFFSGGYDSLVATDVVHNHLANPFVEVYPDVYRQRVVKVVHVNTVIGIEETRQYVRMMAQWMHWELAEYTTPVRYEDIIKRYGFPGPSSHRYMYVQLKERAIDQLVRDHTYNRTNWRSLIAPVLAQSECMTLAQKQLLYASLLEMYPIFKHATHSRILFVTGVRKQESKRRMGHVKPIQEQGRRVWVAPLLNWTKEDIYQHIDFWQLPRNQVVDMLHMSGECLCGSYAHQGELDEICFWYPETGEHIKELEKMVRGEGFVWGWEDAPPSWWNAVQCGQTQLPGFASLCSSCEARHA